ncbi:hypothetical protein [Rothia mucilaginosa]
MEGGVRHWGLLSEYSRLNSSVSGEARENA